MKPLLHLFSEIYNSAAAKQAAGKGWIFGKLTEDIPPGLKPVVFISHLRHD
jgi:hypothetical protein